MFASIPQGLSIFEEKTVIAISFRFQDKKYQQINQSINITILVLFTYFMHNM